MSKSKFIYFRCDDDAETVTFVKFPSVDGPAEYELNIMDSYTGGDYKGIKGRLKRAWCAFWANPVYYTGIYCEDESRMKQFLTDCLKLIEEK